EVDHVAPQSPQAVFATPSGAFGAAIDVGRRASARWRDQPELAREDHVVSARTDRFANEDFIGALAVRVGGVNQGHTQLDRAVERSNRLLVVHRAIALGHPHAPEPEWRGRWSVLSQLSRLHSAKTTLQSAAGGPYGQNDRMAHRRGCCGDCRRAGTQLYAGGRGERRALVSVELRRLPWAERRH